MTEKEAIESLYFLSVRGFSGFTTDKPLRMAIQALEKRVPMKPVLKNGESVAFVDYADGHGECKTTKWQDWVCPVCGWFVGQRYNRLQKRPHDQRKSNFCNECGQRIDWSEVDEKLPAD